MVDSTRLQKIHWRYNVRFQKLDLNLLVALDALLTEKSVSLAADRICLSQSATSSALGRLRDYFEDDLLVRKGRSMVLTTRGHQLVEPVRGVLEQIQNSIATVPTFEPAESDRTISIMTSDYTTEVLLSEAFDHFKNIAPNISFRILNVSQNTNVIEQLNRGVTDLVVSLSELCPEEHPHLELFRDDFVVVGWEENPHFTDQIDQKTYSELGHIVTEMGNARMPTFEGWVLKQNQIQRRVEISVPNFLSIPLLLSGTERIATVHRRLAKRFTRWLPLKTAELPFEIPNLSISAIWHRSSENDPCIKWLVEELAIIASRKEEPATKGVSLHGEHIETFVAASRSSRG